MAGRDYSEYEKIRAESHEYAWRFATTLVNITDRHCHYRVCRRNQACSGPMLPSDHQRGAVWAQKEIGLSGKACADLPMCMVDATADHYAYVGTVCRKLTDLRDTDFKDYSPMDFLCLVRETMRREHPGRSAPLTSPAQRPTSASKHEG